MFVLDTDTNLITSVGSSAYVDLTSKTLGISDILETSLRGMNPAFEHPTPTSKILITYDANKFHEYKAHPTLRTRDGAYYTYNNDMEEYVPENEDLYDELATALSKIG